MRKKHPKLILNRVQNRTFQALISYVHAACWAGRVVAHQAPCRGLPPVVSQPVSGHVTGDSLCDTRPCHRPLPITIQNFYRDPSPCCTHIAPRVTRSAASVVAPSVVSWRIAVSYRGALMRRIAALVRCIMTQSRPPQPRYNFFSIATQGPPSSRYKLCITASLPGQAAHALCVVSQASSRRVVCTTGSIMAMPGRVAPPS